MTVEEILGALKAIIDGAEGRSLTDEEVERYEALEVDLAAQQRDVQVRSRQAAYETPTTAPVVATGTSQKADDTLERAFDAYMRTGQVNHDIVELRAQGVGTDAAGGFTVPETMRQKLQESMLAFGGLATVVETITTTAGEDLRWPTLNDTGNQGSIAAEGAAGTGGADLVFGEKVLGAFKYVAPGATNLPLRVSVELLQDSAFDIAGLVQRKLGERIGRNQAVDWVNGAGTTEPFGISTGTASATWATTDVITYGDLVDAVHEVDPEYRVGASWSFNDATLALIEKIVDGNGRPLLTPAGNGVNTGPTNATLLGYPVVIDQAWANKAGANNKWGAFGNLNTGYVIRRVKDLTLIVNPFSRANEGQVEYTLWARADGVTQDTGAYRVQTNAAV